MIVLYIIRNKGTNVGDVTAETAVSLSVSQSQLQEPLTSQLPLKKTSFQITSVTTIDSSASNDGGEESGEEEMETGGGSSEIPSGIESCFNFILNLI